VLSESSTQQSQLGVLRKNWFITKLNLSKSDNIDIIDDNRLKNLRNGYYRLRFLKPGQSIYPIQPCWIS
jgi:hypothetical protein